MDSRLFDAIDGGESGGSRGKVELGSSLDVLEIKRDLESIKEMLGGNINMRTRQSERADTKKVSITPKEREVLILISKGLMNKEIAGKQSISVRSVEKHISSMLLKSGCSTRTELVRWAIETKRIDIL